MPYYLTMFVQPTGVRLPYQQATAAQRALAVDYLQQRLGSHFPTLRASTWSHALVEHQPDVWLTGQVVTLAKTDLTQLAQHLAAAPELPLLDPPIYGLPALSLAQHSLQLSELAAWALPEIVAAAICGPRLYRLLYRLAHSLPLAEQVVQAWCWNLASAPPLPPNVLRSGPAPGSPEVEAWLRCLRQLSEPLSGPTRCPGSQSATPDGPAPPDVASRGAESNELWAATGSGGGGQGCCVAATKGIAQPEKVAAVADRHPVADGDRALAGHES